MSKTLTWREIDGQLTPVVDGNPAVWAPMPGSQEAFLSCPVFEVLYHGTRGGGKTDCLLMDFGQHVGQGFGAEWRGILFRQSYPQLADVIAKTRKWFPRIWPQAKFNETRATWTWPAGESLQLRFIQREEDYWSYHGHSYPWIGWEELTTWADLGCYLRMMSCSRSTIRTIPRKYRSTTNPYGPGHNVVKLRWRLPGPSGIIGPVITDSRTRDGQLEPPRVAIRSTLDENLVLRASDPEYKARLRSSARSRAELAAWVEGSWDIVAGGMFDDVWDPSVHVIPAIPPMSIPKGWRLDRSYDHGQSRPFSVGWWAQSNGEPFTINGRILGQVPGDLIRVAEWYGWTGDANEGLRLSAGEIAQGILEREAEWGIRGRVRTGIADSSIFDDYEPGRSVAGDMRRVGVRWDPADKGPGSRRQGWQQIRKFLRSAATKGLREEPGLLVCDSCVNFLRTVPSLGRSERDPDDVDTDHEDHVADEVRYRVRAKRREAKGSRWK